MRNNKNKRNKRIWNNSSSSLVFWLNHIYNYEL